MVYNFDSSQWVSRGKPTGFFIARKEMIVTQFHVGVIFRALLYAVLAALPTVVEGISKNDVFDWKVRTLITLGAVYQALLAIKCYIDRSSTPPDTESPASTATPAQTIAPVPPAPDVAPAG